MNIAQLSEQLKDVPQNRLVDYAKNPNSVVPQFLALAEIQRRQHLSANPQPAAATVAEDVLAQAAPQQMPQQMAPQQVDPRVLQAQAMQHQAQQLPENQPGVAQLPTGMPQGMASGGIVAFADGGEAEDEDAVDEYGISKEDMGIMSALSRLKERTGSAIAGLPRAIQSVKASLPSSFEQMRKDHPVAPSVQEGGIDELISKVKHLESRGRHFDAQGNILTSPKGAEGSMQVMRHTQKDPGYGVTPARDKSPEELERVGKDYFVAMMREFKDPKLAAMAYNWGPGNVKKWLESDRRTPVPAETSKYASHFAQGGIASFAGPYGSVVEDSYSDHPNWMLSNAGITSINPYAARLPVTPAITEPSSGYDFKNMDIGFGPGKDSPDSDLEQYGQRQPTEYENLKAQIRQGREDVKSQADTDKYLAMLQASLGMMAGTSPYAMANIGQGGMQGVAAYAGAKKQRAADLAALDKLDIGLFGAKSSADLRKEYIDASKETRKAETERKIGAESRRTEEKYVDNFNSFVTGIRDRAAKSIPLKDVNGLPLDTEERIRLIQMEENRLFQQNKKILEDLAQRAKVPLPDFSAPAPKTVPMPTQKSGGFWSDLFGGNKTGVKSNIPAPPPGFVLPQ